MIFDVIDQTHEANDRTLCGRVEITPRGLPEWDWKPYFPGGTVQVQGHRFDHGTSPWNSGPRPATMDPISWPGHS